MMISNSLHSRRIAAADGWDFQTWIMVVCWLFFTTFSPWGSFQQKKQQVNPWVVQCCYYYYLFGMSFSTFGAGVTSWCQQLPRWPPWPCLWFRSPPGLESNDPTSPWVCSTVAGWGPWYVCCCWLTDVPSTGWFLTASFEEWHGFCDTRLLPS